MPRVGYLQARYEVSGQMSQTIIDVCGAIQTSRVGSMVERRPPTQLRDLNPCKVGEGCGFESRAR